MIIKLIKKIAYCFFSLLSLTACVNQCLFKANFLSPPENVLQNQVEEALEAGTFTPVSNLEEKWWLFLQDPQLQALIEIALEKNPSLQSAEAQVLAAGYTFDRTRAALYPTVNLLGDIQRERISKNTPFLSAVPLATGTAADLPNSSAIPFSFTQYETNLSFNWNLDLWGKNRNALLATFGEIKAAAAEQKLAQLIISIALASNYYSLQTAYQRQAYNKIYVDNRQRYLDLINLRIQNNIDSNFTLLAAKNDLATAKVSLLQIEADIAVYENQIQAYLADGFNYKFEPYQVLKKPLPKVPIPEELPLHLIAYRPDLSAKLWLIESAGHSIEVARAGFYPDFNLLGFIGLQSASLKTLFEKKSVYGDGQLAFNLPIFNAGLLNANLKSAVINYELAIYDYNQNLLDAVKEVLDALALVKNFSNQLKELKNTTQYQAKILNLTKDRLVEHVATGLDQLNSQKQYVIILDQEMIAWGKMMQAVLNLVKALGGGYYAKEWDECTNYQEFE